jgi:hypothetical protein
MAMAEVEDSMPCNLLFISIQAVTARSITKVICEKNTNFSPNICVVSM